jgi:hypothetical protein
MSEPALPDVREWAIAQQIPGVGRRGPVGYEAQVAYSQAHGLPEPAREERAPREKRQRAFSGPSCSCGRRWEGLVECHCRRCHVHFKSVSSFDQHIMPIPGTERTWCADPLTLTYRSGSHKGERKFREIAAHHGLMIVRAEERPDQEEIESR